MPSFVFLVLSGIYIKRGGVGGRIDSLGSAGTVGSLGWGIISATLLYKRHVGGRFCNFKLDCVFEWKGKERTMEH